MSYNTRRSNYGTPQQSASVGQRRPVVSNNFVSGGQLSGSQQQAKPPQQQPQQQQQQQRTPQQQQQSGISFRQNQPGQQQQQSYSTQSYSSTSTPQQGRYQQGQSTPIKQDVKPAVQQQAKPAAQPAPVVPGANPPAPDDTMDSSGEGKKKMWPKNRVKISKAEKLRRRNLRLSKLLQPKNAVMILNELIKGCVYNVEELPVKVDANQFRGTVSFEGQEFAGTGRTKSLAKNAAAETALKHLVKNKQLITTPAKTDEEGDEKMELGEDDESGVMPWSHIASFAMYKLFSNWGEDISLVNKVSAQEIMANNPSKQAQPAQPKPAKKMPANPETMNPMMLMHQMVPNAVWEEVGKSGAPPNVQFTYAVTVEGQQYTGNGSSKKIAKKMAAFSACHDLFKINYPPDVWTPLY